MSAYPAAEGRELVAVMERIATRVRWILIARSFAQWLFVLIPLALVCLWLDVWLRIDSLGWRWVLAMAFFATAVVTFVMQVLPSLTRRISAAMVARRIETTFPELGDRISTAIDLSEQSQAADDLRSWAISSAAKELARIDYQQALDWRPTLRAIGLSCLVCLLFALSFLHPGTRLAAVHLGLPFTAHPWPRQHRLELAVPPAIHIGQDLAVHVRDLQGALPKDLTLWVRTTEPQDDFSLLATVSDKSSDNYEWSIPKIQGTVSVRATGGDDQNMAWRTIDVYQGAKITQQRIEIVPPKYVNQPVLTLDGGEHFEALKGSRIGMLVTFDAPLKDLQVIDAASGKQVAKAQVALEEEGRRGRITIPDFDVPLSVTLRWEDERALPSRAQQVWRFDLQADKPPSVVWEQPAQDITVTSNAQIAIAFRTQDDFGIEASYLRSDRVPDEKLQIAMPKSGEPTMTWQGQGTLDLSQITGLQSGLSFAIVAIAVDSAGQTTSVERTVQIVDAAVIQDRVAELQQRAMQSLRRSVTQQRQSQTQLEATHGLNHEEAAEQLNSASDNQAAAKRAVLDGPEAAKPLLEQANRLLSQNQMDTPHAQTLSQWQQRIDQQIAQEMLNAEDLLDLAKKQLDDASLKSPQGTLSTEIARSINEVLPHQSKAHEALEAILADMAREDSARQAAFELNEVEREQRQLNQRTIAADNAGKPDDRLASRQSELARELAHAMDALKASDSASAQAALQELERSATSTEMLRAAADLNKDALKAAAEKQARIEQSLQAAKRALAGKTGTADAPSDSASLSKIADRTRTIRDGQRQIVDDLQRSVAVNELAIRQHQLIEQTQQLSSELKEERAVQAVLAATLADMQTAAAGLDRGRTGSRVETPARDAWQRLNALVAASEVARDEEKEADENAPQRPDANEKEPSSKAMASLRLWRELQKWLQSETAALDEAIKGANETQRRELTLRRNQLSDHQAKLAAEIQSELERAMTGGEDASPK